jgi:polyamine oxidase
LFPNTTQEGGDVLLPGGYKELMQEIAKGIQINLESSVTAIDYSGDSVQVTYKDASGNDIKSMASHVIVTVPAGVLAHGYSCDLFPFYFWLLFLLLISE